MAPQGAAHLPPVPPLVCHHWRPAGSGRVREGQGWSGRVREGQGGSGRVREGQAGLERVREGLAGWKAIWLVTYMITCKAMGLLLLVEKICSSMGLKIACRGTNGMGKAKCEWQTGQVGRRTWREEWRRGRSQCMICFSEMPEIFLKKEKGGTGSISRMLTAEGKGRGRAKSKESN